MAFGTPPPPWLFKCEEMKIQARCRFIQSLKKKRTVGDGGSFEVFGVGVRQNYLTAYGAAQLGFALFV